MGYRSPYGRDLPVFDSAIAAAETRAPAVLATADWDMGYLSAWTTRYR
jgi:hypothetical protein